jgi:hypothetical protein
VELDRSATGKKRLINECTRLLKDNVILLWTVTQAYMTIFLTKKKTEFRKNLMLIKFKVVIQNFQKRIEPSHLVFQKSFNRIK